MKTKIAPSYLIHEQDVQLFYQALLHYEDSLKALVKWTDDPSAQANIKEEAQEYRKLIMDIYMKCFNTNTNLFTERTNEHLDALPNL